ncbi:MAG: lysylphosphatidylglycerol synthase transmembrane domain-containing protein [Candidatus Sumerlaeota bacterium]
MKRKHLIQLFIGIVISAVALYFVFRGVTLPDLWDSFKKVEYIWLLPCLLTFYFGIWVRAVRWKYLFKPDYDIPLRRSTAGMFICFAFNSVFPARVGEFARAYLIGKKENTGFSTAFGTVVAERLLDSLVLLGALFLALLIAPIDLTEDFTQEVLGRSVTMTPEKFASYKSKLFILTVIMAIGIALVAIPFTRRLSLKIMHTMTFIPQKLRDIVESLVENFAQGLQAFSSPGRSAWLVGLTMLAWCCNFWSAQILAAGFPFENSVSFLDALTITVVVAIFITIPAAPGYWGFYEAGVLVSITMLLGIHPEGGAIVLAYAILLHLTQWLPITLIGLPWAWVSHVSLEDAGKVEEKKTDEGVFGKKEKS